jgi:hypothetical protein
MRSVDGERACDRLVGYIDWLRGRADFMSFADWMQSRRVA